MAATPESSKQAGPRDRAAKPVDPATIATHSALALLLTFALLFGVATITRWVMGPSPISDAVPQVRLRLLVIGACAGLLLAGLILSKPGKISGAHANPAISLAMWRRRSPVAWTTASE
ncbi:hypothetical protein ACFLIM_47895 [Nonomuraea sp. M3C6]|uniref:Uncharacterized protein n=1 Tax=Nonomuraea marmarensis TaxID=3351344 RepID=A0ABW7AXF0_9ACTN